MYCAQEPGGSQTPSNCTTQLPPAGQMIVKVIGRKSGKIMITPQPPIFITWKTMVPNMSLQ